MPLARASPYTESFSVAAMTSPPMTSGCPYTAPSSLRRHAMPSGPASGRPDTDPVRAAFAWYTGQFPAAAAAEGSEAAGLAVGVRPAV